MKQTHSGGCQCGKVRYEASFELGEVMSCNCSRCARLGSLLAFLPADDFKLMSGEGAMTEYEFNKHVIHHLFCATCGIQSFARGQRPDGGAMVSVNVRTLDGVDLAALKIKKFDGRSL
jgi:hypothetical protein